MANKVAFIFLFNCAFFLGFGGNGLEIGGGSQDSTLITSQKPERLFRVGMGIGTSKRFGSLDQIPADYHFYYNDLKVGGYYQMSVDYGHFNKVNIGVTYNQYQTQKLLPNTTFEDSLGNITTGNYSDRIRIRELMVRISSKKYLGSGENVVVWSSIGAGMAFYSQQTVRGVLEYQYTGSSMVLGISSGIDVFVSKHVALGAEFNFTYSQLGKATYDDGVLPIKVVLPETQKINLSKLEFGIGCRYYF